MGFLSDNELVERATALAKSGYGTYLLAMVERERTGARRSSSPLGAHRGERACGS